MKLQTGYHINILYCAVRTSGMLINSTSFCIDVLLFNCNTSPTDSLQHILIS